MPSTFLKFIMTGLLLALLFTSQTARAEPETREVTLLFFWGVGCPHCEQAKPFVAGLTRQYPQLRIESVEVRKDAAGRKRFVETMKRLGATAAGVPTFVVGERYVVGFTPGTTESEVRSIVEAARGNQRAANAGRTRLAKQARLICRSISPPTSIVRVQARARERHQKAQGPP